MTMIRKERNGLRYRHSSSQLEERTYDIFNR
jgi:hypothetical protein